MASTSAWRWRSATWTSVSGSPSAAIGSSARRSRALPPRIVDSRLRGHAGEAGDEWPRNSRCSAVDWGPRLRRTGSRTRTCSSPGMRPVLGDCLVLPCADRSNTPSACAARACQRGWPGLGCLRARATPWFPTHSSHQPGTWPRTQRWRPIASGRTSHYRRHGVDRGAEPKPPVRHALVSRPLPGRGRHRHGPARPLLATWRLEGQGPEPRIQHTRVSRLTSRAFGRPARTRYSTTSGTVTADCTVAATVRLAGPAPG